MASPAPDTRPYFDVYPTKNDVGARAESTAGPASPSTENGRKLSASSLFGKERHSRAGSLASIFSFATVKGRRESSLSNGSGQDQPPTSPKGQLKSSSMPAAAFVPKSAANSPRIQEPLPAKSRTPSPAILASSPRGHMTSSNERSSPLMEAVRRSPLLPASNMTLIDDRALDDTSTPLAVPRHNSTNTPDMSPKMTLRRQAFHEDMIVTTSGVSSVSSTMSTNSSMTDDSRLEDLSDNIGALYALTTSGIDPSTDSLIDAYRTESSRGTAPQIVKPTVPMPVKAQIKSIDEILREHGAAMSIPSSKSLTPDSAATTNEDAGSVTLTMLQSGSKTPSSASDSDSLLCDVEDTRAAQRDAERDADALLRDPRLTRVVTLQRPPFLGLNVSFAEVGRQDGHPVIVLLGLGCVRYLVALYDEVAQSLGLRLICVDRWGLGKTGDVPEHRKSFQSWASIIAELADQLLLPKFSVLAHSAGCPFACEVELLMQDRIRGPLHLLAPWLSSAAGEGLAGPYRYLKYVPTSFVRASHSADQTVTSWRLGKPNEKPQTAAIGYDRRTDTISEGALSTPKRGLVQTLFGTSPKSPSSPTKPQSAQSPLRGSPLRSPVKGNFLNRSMSKLSREERSSTPDHANELTPADLADAILRASHAESMKGATADLMLVLKCSSLPASPTKPRPYNLSPPTDLSRIRSGVKVWMGDKDNRISLASVLSLEKEIPDTRVQVVEGDHNLMTNGKIMLQVLESLAEAWKHE